MPVVFDEISGEVSPERGSERSERAQQPGSARDSDPAELLHRELKLLREREQRLVVD
jgi:hypothetical protein